MDFLQLMQERYTTKHYDNTKVVPQDTLDKILECARLTPTAVNSQPYHFYVASGAAKEKLRPAVKDFNLTRYDGASHVVVVSALTKINDVQLGKVLDAESAAGRLGTEELRQAQDKSRRFFDTMHVERGDFNAWCGKQAYIALASILYSAQGYGVDSTALEGIDEAKVDEILDLPAKGENCQYMVLLGYRAANDSNTTDKRPKSRLDTADVITVL